MQGYRTQKTLFIVHYPLLPYCLLSNVPNHALLFKITTQDANRTQTWAFFCDVSTT